jgi:hypothetical protein
MYLHIIYKNGEKGGIDLTGKDSFVISDDFDSDVYVDVPINTTVHVKDDRLKFDGLSDDVIIEHVIKDGDFYELPCSIITDNINLIFTPKEKSLDDFEYKSPDDATSSEVISEPIEEDISEIEEDLETPSLKSTNTDPIKDKPKNNTIQASKNNQNKFSNKKNILYLVIILVCIGLVLLLVIIYKNRHHKANTPEVKQVNKVQVKPLTLEETIAKIEKSFPKLLIRQASSKTYEIIGLVATPQQISQITSLAKPFKTAINIQLFDVNVIIANTKNIFKKYNVKQYSVSATDTNTILIKYFSNDNTDVDGIQSDILDKYPSELEDSFSIQVSTSSELSDVLESLSKKYETITTKLENGTVLITGSIAEDKKEAVTQDIEEIETTYKGLIKFNKDIKLSTQILPIKISMIYTGYPSWIILDNGKQIYQGEEYNGFVLKQITNDKVTFSGKYNVEIPVE